MLSNSETYAHIGLIARHGPEWFRSLGTAWEPGTLLLTVTGAVARPGVLEVPFGTTIGAAVNLAGGADPGTPAVLLCGYAGTWLCPGVVWEMSLSTVMLRGQHASLGVGLIAILPTNFCVLTENARILHWLADESARQCGPCRSARMRSSNDSQVDRGLAALSRPRAVRRDRTEWISLDDWGYPWPVGVPMASPGVV